MKVNQEQMAFKPVTITLETLHEFEIFRGILFNVDRRTDTNIDEQKLADYILEFTDF